MKVLFVLGLDPLPNIIRYVTNTSLALRNRGMDVYVLVPDSEEMPDIRGVRVMHWSRQDNSQAIRGILREIRPQVVQLENCPQLVRPIRQTFHSQLVLHLHSLSPLSSDSISRRELRVALCLVDKVVLASHFLKSLFIGRFYGLRLRTAVIHPGVDTKMFRPIEGDAGLARERAKLRRSWGVANEEVVALFSGPPLPDKAFDLVLTTWAALAGRKVRLVVVGGMFANRIDSASEWVTALGEVPHENMPAVFRAADLFVYPCQGREALGQDNLEAMATGLPIAASFRGGVVELVDPSCGYLIRQYADAATWSRGIIHLVEHPDLRLAMGRASVERSKLFTWERTAHAFLQLYSES